MLLNEKSLPCVQICKNYGAVSFTSKTYLVNTLVVIIVPWYN